MKEQIPKVVINMLHRYHNDQTGDLPLREAFIEIYEAGRKAGSEDKPEWLQKVIAKENISEALRDIIGRYRTKPNHKMGEYSLTECTRFMITYLECLALKTKEYVEKEAKQEDWNKCIEECCQECQIRLSQKPPTKARSKG